jgi:divalent metal cation (Fe/Co/Zn/Cd) transporter
VLLRKVLGVSSEALHWISGAGLTAVISDLLVKTETMDLSFQTQRQSSLKKGLSLEYFTVGYNLLEAVVAVLLGVGAGSIALVGFGLDSLVESSSGGILIWRLRAETTGGRTAEEVEQRAVKLVALAFFALTLYVGIRSLVALLTQSEPEESVPGIILSVVSLIVMPLLAVGKKRVSKQLDSRALEADATQTLVCVWLSVFLLVGLGANALFGWWWADPLAGVGIAVYAAKEGWELWSGEED